MNCGGRFLQKNQCLKKIRQINSTSCLKSFVQSNKKTSISVVSRIKRNHIFVKGGSFEQESRWNSRKEKTSVKKILFLGTKILDFVSHTSSRRSLSDGPFGFPDWDKTLSTTPCLTFLKKSQQRGLKMSERIEYCS